MNFRTNNPQETEASMPQLPSLVDVVFILLIFFLVLSVLGIGIVESGEHSQDIYDKEQEVSDFPKVKKALRKEMTEFLILALEMDDKGKSTYHVFSNTPYFERIIESVQEYETVRRSIQNGDLFFENAPLENQMRILQEGWGPFSEVSSMRRAEVVTRVDPSESNLIIQANERFTYHDILQIMGVFNQFESVYFEVIENESES
jgi:biopolymer transport protein ExbD